MEEYFYERSLSLLASSDSRGFKRGECNITVRVAAVTELSAMRSQNWRRVQSDLTYDSSFNLKEEPNA